MFFYLSKILQFLLSPLVWAFTFFSIAYFSKQDKKRKVFLAIGLLVLYISSNAFFVDECMRAWEFTTEDMKKTEQFDCAIVLGGMITYDARLDKPRFRDGSDRLFQTLELFWLGQVKKILITGGSGSIEFPDHKEAAILKKYLLHIGVPDSCVIIENESKNTYENALFTKKITDQLNTQTPYLFVTSSFHMRRAIACFNKAGISNIRPYPTDRYSGRRKFGWDHCFIPDVGALQQFSLLIHEITGYCIYKITGKA